MAMRSASRANTRSVVAPSIVAVFAPVRHSSQVPETCTTVCVGAKAARRGDLLEQRLDVGAEELRRAVAGGADEMEMPRMAVRGLEARPPLAEIHLAGDAGADHPLQRAVDRRAADARVLAADEIAQIVRAQMAFLADEDTENSVALRGALAARRPQARDIGKRTIHQESVTGER